MKPESVPANNWSLIISQNPTECSKLQTSDYIRWTNQIAFALTALQQSLVLKQDFQLGLHLARGQKMDDNGPYIHVLAPAEKIFSC